MKTLLRIVEYYFWFMFLWLGMCNIGKPFLLQRATDDAQLAKTYAAEDSRLDAKEILAGFKAQSAIDKKYPLRDFAALFLDWLEVISGLLIASALRSVRKAKETRKTVRKLKWAASVIPLAFLFACYRNYDNFVRGEELAKALTIPQLGNWMLVFESGYGKMMQEVLTPIFPRFDNFYVLLLSVLLFTSAKLLNEKLELSSRVDALKTDADLTV